MSKRSFKLPDHGLWDEVRRNISPLNRSQNKSQNRSTAGSEPATPPAASSPGLGRPPVAKRHNAFAAPPPLAAFDRRTAQRLSRGQLEPESRIDLHGLSAELARVRLLHFVEAQRLASHRLVLVITGKGASPFGRHTLHGKDYFHAPEREGRLRRDVPSWLEDPAFRSHVAGFQPAHPRHGGGGAFYVRLRRLAD